MAKNVLFLEFEAS